jgi:hypothetical protein
MIKYYSNITQILLMYYSNTTQVVLYYLLPPDNIIAKILQYRVFNYLILLVA